MIAGLKSYPSLTDSGLPWLGQIPESWRTLRAKSVFKVIDVRSEGGAEELLTVSSKDGVLPRSEKNVTMFKAESYVGHKLCWPGDLVINSLWAWMQGLGFSQHHGLVSSAYSVYRPKAPFANYAQYFHFALRSAAYKWELQTRSKGVWLSRLQLSDSAFLDMPIVLPPSDEQAAIVRFLDYADRRVRSYIRTKQKLIKLLEEQKLGIIQSAMTRGLDLNTKLRPSGVEWIGDVPESWEIKRLKYAVPGVTVGIVIQPAQLYVPSGVPCLRSLNISKGKIDAQEIVYISEQSNSTNRKSQLHCGDIVVVRTGKAGVAVVIPPEYEGANCVDLLIIRKSSRILSDYLLTYLNSYAAGKEIEYRSVGAIQAHYNTGTLANLLVAIPSVAEQQSILTFLKDSLRPLYIALQSARREINLLTDLRARLIADVVTGKRDVRDASEKLAQEIQGAVTITETDELTDEDEGAIVASVDEAAEEAEA